MNNIFLIGIGQALFFVLLLLSKKNKSLSDKVLTAWLGFIALHLLMAFGDSEGWHNHSPHWLGLSFPLPLWEGPFFFLYVLTLTRNPSRISWYDWLHFLPMILVYLSSWEFFSSTGPEKVHFMKHVLWNDPPIVTRISLVLVNVTGLAYAIYVLWQVRSHRKNIRKFFSYSDEIDLQWIRNLAIGMMLIWGVVWGVGLAHRLELPLFFHSNSLIYLAVSCFVFAIGYFGFKQGRIFSFDSVPPVELEPEPSGKYHKSGLKRQDQDLLLDKLKEYMERETPYLNPQLTLGELAEKIELSPHHLSQLINDGLEQNFFEFVNQFRVAAFQNAVRHPANKHLTLLAIAMDCGFNSKSSFNRTFKQLTGQTPSQYAKNALPKQ